MNQRSANNRAGVSQPVPVVTISLIAIASFVAAHRVPYCAPLILVYLISLCRLIDCKLPSQAFYSGLIVGTVSFATELAFFWKIFGIAAVALWGILGFWIGLFLLIAQQFRITLGNRFLFASLPLIWLGLEYFRSEGYFLKFSWLAVGSPFVNSPVPLPAFLGSYGTGSLMVWLAHATSRMKRIPLLSSTFILLMAFSYLSRTPPSAPLQSVRESPALHIAGIQLEFPSPSQIIRSLDTLVNQHPAVDLIVLSEYSLQSPPTDAIKQWCRAHKKHLIIGGKDPVNGDRYRNTAFVVGPDGKVLFKQAKSEPIQFFDDGEPALKQDLWESPWGSIGIAICYDLSLSLSQVLPQDMRRSKNRILMRSYRTVYYANPCRSCRFDSFSG